MTAADTGDYACFAYINCEGIDGLYERYVAAGAVICQPLSDKPWGMRAFGVAPPDGHRNHQ